MKEIYLGGGCFWGLDHYIGLLPGIIHHEAGYANGSTMLTDYGKVCRGSGHSEVVRVVYEESILRTAELLVMYFQVIDPFSINRQGNDRGIQYRTGIYASDPLLLQEAREVLNGIEESLGKPVAVEVLPLENYCKAEDYHQEYLEKNPGGYCHISAEAFRQAALFRDEKMKKA